MIDTQHQLIPEEIRRARSEILRAAIEAGYELALGRHTSPDYVRVGPYALRLVDFPEPGQELIVAPLLLGQGEIRVGVIGAAEFDRAWMYEHLGDAVAAACVWFLDREHRTEPEDWRRRWDANGVRYARRAEWEVNDEGGER
jgi:hypothetical protein